MKEVKKVEVEEVKNETQEVEEQAVVPEVEKSEEQLKTEGVIARIDEVLGEENFTMIPVLRQVGQFDYKIGVQFIDLGGNEEEVCEDKPSE